MKKIIIRALTCASFATGAFASELIVPPKGTDNLEFEFVAGECPTDGISIKVTGNSSNFVTTDYGCNFFKTKQTFRWQTNGTFDGFNLFGVYVAGSSETKNRKTIAIKDAYWTSGFAFAGSLWSDGVERVVVVPEPDTWALMIVGFGMVGGALRRRTSLATA